MSERLAKNLKTVIIGNNREYFSPLDQNTPPEEKDEFVQSDIDEADMDIMWLGDDKVVILPYDLEPEFVKDVANFFNYKNFQVLSPANSTTQVSGDLLNEKESKIDLGAILKSHGQINLIPWGHTQEFQTLLEKFNKTIPFQTPETPLAHSLWTPDYLDTKLGSREFLRNIQQVNPNFLLPEGFPVSNLTEAIQVSNHFLDQGKGVVFKANLGGAGVGVAIMEPEMFNASRPDNLKLIEQRLRTNPLFGAGVIIVEEYIKPNFDRPATFPSVDSLILPNGKTEVQSVDGMVIHHNEGHVGFYGCVAGKGLYTKSEFTTLKDFAFLIGDHLSTLGYRGWFDTDYILAKSGKFYSTEVNLRRTSMSHLVEIGKAIAGPNWEQEIAVRSNDKFIRKNLRNLSHHQIKEIVKPLVFPLADKRRGVIITQSYRSMFGRGKFGYVVIGDDQEDAIRIESSLEKQLEQLLS